MQIPGIYVPIQGDATQLKKEIAQTKEYIVSQATGISNALNNALSADKISGNVQRMVQNFGTLNRAASVTSGVFDNIGVDLKELTKNTGLSEKELQKLQSRLLSTQAAKAQESALKRLATQLNLTEQEARELGAQFGMSLGQIDRVVGASNKAAMATANVGGNGQKSMNLFAGSIALAAGKFLLLEQAAYSVGRILDNVVFRFNSTVETATIGIAAAFLNNGKYVDQITGKVLAGQQAMSAAEADAVSVIERLRGSNLQTIATLEQLIKAYQEAVPVALSKAFNKEQVQNFTVAMMQAAGAIDTTGTLMNQMGEEMRSLLNGGITPKNTRIATALGITNEDVARYKGDVEGLYNFLMSKLSAYQMFGERLQNTWKGVASNTLDIFQQVAAKASEPIFIGVRDGLKSITDEIATIDQATGSIKWNDNYTEGVERVKGEIEEFISLIKSVDAADMFDSLGEAASGSIGAIKGVTLGVAGVYEASNKLLDLGAFEWGIIGYALLRGGPQAAALAAALGVINAQLGEFNLGVEALPGKMAAAMDSWGKLGKNLEDVSGGKRDPKTGDLLGVSAQEKQIDSLKRKLVALEAQKEISSKNPLVSSLFGKDLKKTEEDIAKVKDAITAVQEEAKKTSGVKYEPVGRVTGEELEQLAKKIEELQKKAEKGRADTLKYIQTEKEAIFERYNNAVKYAKGEEEISKAKKVRDEQLAALEKRGASGALKGERDQLKQLNAELRNYSNLAKEAAQSASDWLRDAGRASADIENLVDQYATAGMGEFSRSAYDQGKALKEAELAINSYSGSLETVDAKLAETTAAYQLASSQLEQMQGKMAGNSAGSSIEDLNKLDSLKDQYEKLKKLLIELNAQKSILEGQQSAASNLPDNINESFRVERIKSAYSQIGAFTQDIYVTLEKEYIADAEAFEKSTGNKIAAQEMLNRKMAELELSNPNTSPSRRMEIGMAEYGRESRQEILDFYKDWLPDAIESSSDTFGKFVSDMAQGNAKLGDSWKVLGQMVGDVAADILSDIAKMAMKQGALSLFGAVFGAIGAGAAPAVAPYVPGGGQLLGSAQGNVFDNMPSLSAYSGSIVTRPTYFAKGGNVMGEAGPEGIFPLTRTPSGDLGIKAMMGGWGEQKISIHNYNGSRVDTERMSTGELKVLIRDISQEVALSTVYKETDGLVAGALANTNSRSSKSMIAYHDIRRRRS